MPCTSDKEARRKGHLCENTDKQTAPYLQAALVSLSPRSQGEWQEPVWPSSKAEGPWLSWFRLSLLFNKVVVCGHCLVTLPLTINET